MIVLSFILSAMAIISLVLTIILKAKQRKAERTELQEAEGLSASNSDALFEFELLQNKSDLLKRNKGADPCDDPGEIQYFEYCPTVKY